MIDDKYGHPHSLLAWVFLQQKVNRFLVAVVIFPRQELLFFLTTYGWHFLISSEVHAKGCFYTDSSYAR